MRRADVTSRSRIRLARQALRDTGSANPMKANREAGERNPVAEKSRLTDLFLVEIRGGLSFDPQRLAMRPKPGCTVFDPFPSEAPRRHVETLSDSPPVDTDVARARMPLGGPLNRRRCGPRDAGEEAGVPQ
jgi:hypothetical protein